MTDPLAIDIARATLPPRLNPRLAIHDITLREGEEAADVNFSLDDKLRIYESLLASGVRFIQGGLPARSRIDARFTQIVARREDPVEIEVLVHIFGSDWKSQVNAALDCGAHRVSLMYPLSPVRLEQVQKASPEEALARIEEGVSYARSQGVKVRFSPPDGTRAEIALLVRSFEVATRSGADVVSITDTVGCMTPHSMGYLVAIAARAVQADIQVHCHNDYGLALSNALAAVEAGAAGVDTSVNGLGERAGNVVMAEFVTVLQYLYEVPLGIDLTKLTELSRLVSELSGISQAATQPLTGPNSFAHKLDTHIYGLDRTPAAYEFITPEAVGNKRRIVLGKYSGPYVVRKKLAAMGHVVREEDIPAVVNRLHEEAIRLRRSIEDDELLSIAEQIKNAGVQSAG